MPLDNYIITVRMLKALCYYKMLKMNKLTSKGEENSQYDGSLGLIRSSSGFSWQSYRRLCKRYMTIRPPFVRNLLRNRLFRNLAI